MPLLSAAPQNVVVDAMDRVKDAYQRGDYATALRELRPLAEQGSADAQFNIGLMYNQGRGTPVDYKEAAKWYRLAAEQNLPRAEFYLGVIYFKGQGVPQNFKEAEKLFFAAAMQDDVKAQVTLAQMYETDHPGVPQNMSEAMHWYYFAAQLGNSVGQMETGRLLRKLGRNEEAASWFRLAAEQNDPYAQDFLGLMYANGEGVAQDHRQSYMWFSLAAATRTELGGGIHPAEQRDAVGKKLTATQIADARRLVRDFTIKRELGAILAARTEAHETSQDAEVVMFLKANSTPQFTQNGRPLSKLIEQASVEGRARPIVVKAAFTMEELSVGTSGNSAVTSLTCKEYNPVMTPGDKDPMKTRQLRVTAWSERIAWIKTAQGWKMNELTITTPVSREQVVESATVFKKLLSP